MFIMNIISQEHMYTTTSLDVQSYTMYQAYGIPCRNFWVQPSNICMIMQFSMEERKFNLLDYGNQLYLAMIRNVEDSMSLENRIIMGM
jgi:hypothetical protein